MFNDGSSSTQYTEFAQYNGDVLLRPDHLLCQYRYYSGIILVLAILEKLF
jgi:hypothetical protein